MLTINTELVAETLPICALFQLWDSLAAAAGGVLRGQGRQRIGAWINLAAYYILALPFSFFTAFKLKWYVQAFRTSLIKSLTLLTAIRKLKGLVRLVGWRKHCSIAGSDH